MRKAYGRHLQDQMQIVKAARSASIRLKVHRINMTDDPDEREGETIEGIRAAQFLLEWYRGLPKSRARVLLGRRLPD
jgi:hypothetical protein